MASSSPGNNEFQITAFQRMLSACAGSIINSLVVTPFDVVRIRLQQQQLLEPSQSVAVPTGCCRTQPVFWLSPVDCSSPCATVQPSTVKLTGTWQGLKFIGINEGITSLWKGVSLALFIAIPGNMVYFAGYDHLKSNIPFIPSYFTPLVSGAIARTGAVIAIAPIELVKTRFQAMPSSSSSSSSSSSPLTTLLKDTIHAVRVRGLGQLFKGLELTLWRDVPFSAIYWASYEFFKHRLSLLNRINNSSDVAFVSFLSGSLSGTIAAIATNPFDVGKTRLQVAADEPADTAGVRNTLIKRLRKKRPSMFKFLGDIAKNEGVGALYVGLTPRILKIAPSCAVMISSYEISKHYFAKQYYIQNRKLG
ncbi:Mtm1 protein [Saccharomycopsis crataegensis]|uniref:Mtm1 protein n=1 Tax=Saccharomycopsis crataegensis TaxID=43959 RepID=A0AAV5QDM6_9ASCO|nr:Mtm1 protein [Saccharomycopsis crataegensis]